MLSFILYYMNTLIFMRVRHIYSILFCLSFFKGIYCNTVINGIWKYNLFLLKPRSYVLSNAFIFGFEKICGTYEDKGIVSAYILNKFG